MDIGKSQFLIWENKFKIKCEKAVDIFNTQLSIFEQFGSEGVPVSIPTSAQHVPDPSDPFNFDEFPVQNRANDLAREIQIYKTVVIDFGSFDLLKFWRTKKEVNGVGCIL